MKAIETVYNGYRFRSRLEARWAVFFDSLGIRYQYETEGIDTSKGWYLPDFWLAHSKDEWARKGGGFWAEIKPAGTSAIDNWGLWRQVVIETESSLLAFIGDPWPSEYEIVKVCALSKDAPMPLHGLEFKERVLDGNIVVVMITKDEMRCSFPTATNVDLMAAYIAARQARFEYDNFGLQKVPVISKTVGAQ